MMASIQIRGFTDLLITILFSQLLGEYSWLPHQVKGKTDRKLGNQTIYVWL